MSNQEIKSSVRAHYASIARQSTGCCGPAGSGGGCCGTSAPVAISKEVGYTDADLAAVPEGSNLGLGCGNPLAFAALAAGDVVVDLGSGAGFDCFLAARRVGANGRVIGVDMTPEMLDRARRNAALDGVANVEFRLGEIENLPVADATADVVISNCVINLSTDKPRVFREALRVLKPGGRLMVSDLVLARPLPDSVARSVAAYAGCIAGAMLKDDYLAAIRAAGFVDVEVLAESGYDIGGANADDTETALLEATGTTPEEARAAADAVRSVKVSARKGAL
ncbi:MAG: arsenite methyltransferase [Acidobacteria bacterium]|nr:MAG: arsenite methyltransferase [Acidobacteriota bacterium]